jgi:hypothetical protein
MHRYYLKKRKETFFGVIFFPYRASSYQIFLTLICSFVFMSLNKDLVFVIVTPVFWIFTKNTVFFLFFPLLFVDLVYKN